METNKILNIYPLTKLAIVLTIATSSLIVPGYMYSYFCFFICASIAFLAKKLKDFIIATFKGLGVIILVIFLIQSLFFPGGEILFQLGFITVKEEGFYYALQLTSQIIAIGSSFILFFRITPVKDFIITLEKSGLSPKATYVIISTLNMIPEMRNESEVIMDAQKTRGVETEGNLITRMKAFIPTISPLILSSIANTEERAITLESRGFSVKTPKTYLYDFKKTSRDEKIEKILISIVLILFIGRIILWGFLK